MAKTPAERLPLDRRMALFRAVVDMQDQGVEASIARSLVAKRFQVTEREVREVEEEGLLAEWPPL